MLLIRISYSKIKQSYSKNTINSFKGNFTHPLVKSLPAYPQPEKAQEQGIRGRKGKKSWPLVSEPSDW